MLACFFAFFSICFICLLVVLVGMVEFSIRWLVRRASLFFFSFFSFRRFISLRTRLAMVLSFAISVVSISVALLKRDEAFSLKVMA